MTDLFSDLVPDCFIYMVNCCHIWPPRSQYSFLSLYYIICSNFSTSKIRRNWSWNCAVPFRHTNIINRYFARKCQPQYQIHFIISTFFSFGLLFAIYAKCMWNCHHNTISFLFFLFFLAGGGGGGGGGHSTYQGPYSPYKPYNHCLFIGIIIFPHTDHTQSAGHN